MNKPNRLTRFFFYGDSNTYGFDPRGFLGGRYPADVRWADILQKTFRGTCDFTFEGMNGRSIPVSRTEYRWLEQMIRRASPLDDAAVMLGTNDLLMTARPDAAAAAGRMHTLVEWLLDLPALREAGARVILMIPPYAAVHVRKEDPYYRYYAESVRLAELYRKIPAGHGGRVLCIDTTAWDIELAYDDVHFTEKGSLSFAKEMEGEIRKLLKPYTEKQTREDQTR